MQLTVNTAARSGSAIRAMIQAVLCLILFFLRGVGVSQLGVVRSVRRSSVHSVPKISSRGTFSYGFIQSGMT